MEISSSQVIMPFLVIGAILATAAVLVYGIVHMARGKSASGQAASDRARHSNKLMQYRIILQAAALILFMLMLALR